MLVEAPQNSPKIQTVTRRQELLFVLEQRSSRYDLIR